MNLRIFAKTVLKHALPLLALILAAMALSACGGGEEPQDREFHLRIADGKLNLVPAVIEVNQGDTVTLNIGADEHGTFHLHGYDIEVDVGPDEITAMKLTSDATGSFRITFHPGGEEEHSEGSEGGGEKPAADEHQDEGEEVEIASFQVQPR
jgi:hypothetical protein